MAKFLEKMFSLRNEFTLQGKNKVLTVFGFRIVFKKFNWLRYKKFCNAGVSDNCVLLLELNDAHGETLPGYAKYLSDLGFSVDVAAHPTVYKENPFVLSNGDIKCRFFSLNRYEMITFCESPQVKRYKFVVFNSLHFYPREPEKKIPIFEFVSFDKIQKYFVVSHHLDLSNSLSDASSRVIKLPDFNDMVGAFVNPNYFGKISRRDKNSVTTFISIGGLLASRRNANLLIDAVQRLVQKGETNFKVIVIGCGSLENVPSDLRKYFNITGRVSYREMFGFLENADFLMPLLDVNSSAHDRYVTTGTSGTFQLSYGFIKPCVIATKFAQPHYFSETNSVVYNANKDLAAAMQNAIKMDGEDYRRMCDNLADTVKEIRSKSENNLRKLLCDNGIQVKEKNYAI